MLLLEHLSDGSPPMDPPDALAGVDARVVAHPVDFAAKCAKTIHTDSPRLSMRFCPISVVRVAIIQDQT